MKTRQLILSLFWVFLSQYTFSQNKTYVGFEFGPKFLIYENTDFEGAVITPPFLYKSVMAFTISHELSPHFLIETGGGYQYFGQSYRFKNLSSYGKVSRLPIYEIPIRLKGRIEVIPNFLSFTSFAGYTFGFTYRSESDALRTPDSWGEGSFSGGLGLGTVPFDSIRSSYESYNTSDGNFGLLEAGASLDFRYNENFSIFLAANYKTGLKTIIETDVFYKINDGEESATRIFSKGSYYSFLLGFKYDISWMWRE